jgi:hypothetical protein
MTTKTTPRQAWTDPTTGTIVILEDSRALAGSFATFECIATWIFPNGTIVHGAETQVGKDLIVRLYHHGDHDQVETTL